MTPQCLAGKLRFGRTLLSTAFGITLAAGPIVLGFLNARPIRAQSTQTTAEPLPSFEVASVNQTRPGDTRVEYNFPPGRFIAAGFTLSQLIRNAYGVKEYLISGGPGWIRSAKYNIEAKESDSLAEELEKLPVDQRMAKNKLLLQSLLTDRFKLKVSHATKEAPVYVLVVTRNGPKFQEAKPGDTYPNGIKGRDGHSVGHAGMIQSGRGRIVCQGIPIASLVSMLANELGRTVVDQSSLRGNYDFTLQWAPDQNPAAVFKDTEDGKSGTAGAPPPDSSGPSIFTALQEQLGLKLVSTKGPVQVLVIDHVERPSEN
jgi:bla regulator protein blaR1